MLLFGRPANPPPRRRELGQSVVEFAVILPVILLLLLAIADLGRLYTSAVAVESAAREAADYGAFVAANWTDVNVSVTTDQMQLRACTAAAGSHLQGYETSDPVNNTTCTNPTFTCTLERNGAATPCATSGGFTNGVDCSDPTTEKPCTVHVRMDYVFRPFFSIPPLPTTVQIIRDSFFRISDLTPP
jgi:hypothetical protein